MSSTHEHSNRASSRNRINPATGQHSLFKSQNRLLHPGTGCVIFSHRSWHDELVQLTNETDVLTRKYCPGYYATRSLAAYSAILGASRTLFNSSRELMVTSMRDVILCSKINPNGIREGSRRYHRHSGHSVLILSDNRRTVTNVTFFLPINTTNPIVLYNLY